MPPKNTLGRGLGAMFPDLLNNIGDKPAFVMCGIEELSPNPFQPRRDFNDETQKELIASVKKSGIIQPIVVRKAVKGYEIIAGERRWRAAQAAGLKEVPVIIRVADDREVAELSLIENLQREALNPIEEADAYQTLMTRFLPLPGGRSPLRIGKDRSTIANIVRLLKLPDGVKKALVGKSHYRRTCQGSSCPGIPRRADKRPEDRPAEGAQRPGNRTSDSESEETTSPEENR